MHCLDPPSDCADTGITRSRSRQELLYTRSCIVNAAKAFGLQAIDMVNLLVLPDITLLLIAGLLGLRQLQGSRISQG